jgi:CDP-glycerol glycerophosphotransferase
VLTSADQPYPMPLLWGVDALVTDYSSILVDYAATGRPILYLAPDLEHYAATRGLYFDYAELSHGRRLTTWAEVLARLDELDSPAELSRSQTASRALRDRFQDHQDGQNAARTVRAALELLHR